MILHTVVFALKHAPGSAAETSFLDAAKTLAVIPAVKKFESFRQISRKNDYAFGLSFAFANQAGYDAYNAHPAHVAFVRDRWVPEVARFMEIDYVPL